LAEKGCSTIHADVFIVKTTVERRVWRYQRGNQNPYIEEEQTTQWTKGKGQKDKQRSTKHAYNTKERVTRTSLKTGDDLRCSERISSSWSTSDTHRVNLVTHPVISHEWGKNWEVLSTIHLGKDTDLLIFFLFHFDLDSNDIYFKSMRNSSTTMKIWDIRKKASTLGLLACHIMPFVQAISGCDTTSNVWNGSAIQDSKWNSS